MCSEDSDVEFSLAILDEFVRVANEAADAAGIVVKNFFGKPQSIQTFDKRDEHGCIVEQTTTADLAAEDAMISAILQNFPDHLIFGEERGWFPEERDADYVWVLDPIDGTTSFKNGVPLFGTLIALLYKSKPILGIIDQPILRRRWVGVQGRRTTMDGLPVQTRPCQHLSRATLTILLYCPTSVFLFLFPRVNFVVDHFEKETRDYEAPECQEHRNFTEYTDLYSFGVLFLVLLTGKDATFSSTSIGENAKSTNIMDWVTEKYRNKHISEIVDPVITINEVSTTELSASIELALRCTAIEECRRPTMVDVAIELYNMLRSSYGQTKLAEGEVIEQRGDKYWIFYGSEKNLIKNGAWVLEKSISLFHGKTNPIRYFSTDELNHMNVEYECKLHGCYSMYQGSWEGRAVLVKLLDLPEKVSSEFFREVVGSLTGTHGNDHKVEWHRIELRLRGSHGNVHQLKLCPLPEEKEEEEELLELLREIVVGSQMGTHSNVHKLVGCCLETELPVLVYEWIEDETLEDRILLINKNQKKQPLEWKDRLRIAWEISHAIAYLHTAFPRPIIHTHLTPKTVFLDNNIAKLYNFGSSVSIPDGEEFVKLDYLHGTSGYMAPEYSNGSHVAESIDVYSFGMLFLMLLTAKEVSEQTHNSIGLKEWVQEGIKHKCISDIVDSAITRNGVTAIEELQLRASIHLALSCVVKEAYCRPTMVEVATELKNMITSPESIPSTSTFRGRNIHRNFNGSEENFMQFKALVLQESFSLFHDRVNPIRYFSVHELNTMNVEHDQIFRYCYQGSWEGRSILVKLQNAVTIDSIEIQSSILREILVATQTATHNNVQKLLGCCLETKFPVLVYEWVAAETLEDRIAPKDENQKKLPPLMWKDRRRIAWEISHTVSYLHTAFPRPIIHGNLKPENIFLDQDGSVKLSNFNHFISILKGEELGENVRRIETISGLMIPEYFEGCSVAECADVYSFGLLFLVLLTGKNNASFPSTTTTEHKSTNLIHWVIKAVRMERISEIIDPAINKNEVTTIELRASIDLALRCTTSLADCRPTMADVATELKRMICSHESIPCSISFQEKDIYRSFRGRKEYFMQNEALVLEKNISLFHDRANPIRYFSVDELNNMNIEYYRVFWDGEFNWYQGSWVGSVVWIKLPIRLFDKDCLAFSNNIRLSLLHEVVIATQMATENNVHKLIGCCLETKVPVLVYECMAAHETLEDRMLLKDENQSKLPVLEWNDRLRIALELSQVVSHMHKSFPRPIIHGYLRPNSVFLDQDNTVKLSNFSSSVSIPEGKNFVQNFSFDNSFYMEPEYYEQREVGECTDVYSFGILFLVLLTGKSADFKYTSSAEGHIRSTKLIDWVTEKFRKVCVSKIVDPAIAKTGVSTIEMTASIKLALRCTTERDKRPTIVDVATELEKIIRSSDLPNGFSRLRGCFTS